MIDSDYLTGYRADLGYLTWHWGGAYKISYRLGQYQAVRRDDGSMCRADSATSLLNKIREDYRLRPVPRR